jgi:hypothetical protein
VVHDARGNIVQAPAIADGQAVTLWLGYDSENRLTSAGGGRYGSMTLGYDPLGRLASQSSWYNPRNQWDGERIAIGYTDHPDVPFVRNVHGQDGLGAPLVEAEANRRRYAITDERGSVLANTDAAGHLDANQWASGPVNRYDGYGMTGGEAQTNFQYAGQLWTPGIVEYVG